MKIRSPMTPSAEAYAWRELVDRIGLKRSGGADSLRELGVDVARDAGTPAADRGPGKRLIVESASDEAWAVAVDPTTRPAWVHPDAMAPPGVVLPFREPLPVLFPSRAWDRASSPVEVRSDHTVVFHIDILATCVFMLSRFEEIAVPERDVHDRFPASASVATRHGFLGRPIVDEYALVIGAWVEALSPGWRAPERRLTVKLSHDVDDVLQFPNAGRGVRHVAGDLLRRRSVSEARRQAQSLYTQLVAPTRDVAHRGLYALDALSREYGMKSAFYFMTARPSWRDAGYDLDAPLVRRCFDTIRGNGHEIGFHPGYHTHGDEDRFIDEKRRLDDVLGHGEYGGRQHFLRFRVPSTWRMWERSGLTYDSTMGFADREGFRCGTCHAFRPFDVEEDRELALKEIPLIAMDSTLLAYRALALPEAQASILALADRCAAVGGTFTLLWHNTSLGPEGGERAGMYAETLARLAARSSSAPPPA